MNILGIAGEDIQQGDKCVVGGSNELLPLITLAYKIEKYCIASCDALYGEFVTVFCPNNNKNKEKL